MKELERISAGIAVENKPGPVLIGSTDELNDPTIYQVIARHYYEAFKKGLKTYPFLSWYGQ